MWIRESSLSLSSGKAGRGCWEELHQLRTAEPKLTLPPSLPPSLPSLFHQLAQNTSLLSQYDILSVQPTTLQTFILACLTLSIPGPNQVSPISPPSLDPPLPCSRAHLSPSLHLFPDLHHHPRLLNLLSTPFPPQT